MEAEMEGVLVSDATGDKIQLRHSSSGRTGAA
jgi:hypothetical protein